MKPVSRSGAGASAGAGVGGSSASSGMACWGTVAAPVAGQLQQLVLSLLVADPTARPSAAFALGHLVQVE